MKYSLLGNSGLTVSRLCFGAMTFNDGATDMMKSVYNVGPELAARMVDRSLEAGINFFDTADAYADGDSERLLGACLKQRRNDVVIATKVAQRTGAALTQSGLSRRHIILACEQSLQRLGTEWIDVYIAHREDPHTPLEETLSALDALVQSGKVRYLGFSNWPAWRVSAAMELQRARALAPFTHGQMHYSLLGRDVELEIIPMMRQYGLGLSAWGPLASGFLSGKYNRENIQASGTRFAELDFLPFNKESGYSLVESMRGIAAAHDASIAQVALAWLLAKQQVSSVLIGATALAQLEDNLGALEVNLSPEEIVAMEQHVPLPSVYPHWFIGKMSDPVVTQALAKT